MESGNARAFYIKIDSFAQKHGGKLYNRTVRRLKQQIRSSAARQSTAIEENAFENLCWDYEKKPKNSTAPLISVIVPVAGTNTNLRKCLASIYSQTYQNFEVLILEYDLSDQDKKIITECIQHFRVKTSVVSGNEKAFHTLEQWNEGLEMAKGDLVWIADTSSYCDEAFLQEVVEMFSYGSVKMVFCESKSISCIGAEKEQNCQDNFSGSINFKWEKPFYMTAHNMVKHGFAFRNMIPNIGCAVFKNIGSMSAGILESYKEMNFCAQWIFYLYLIRGGIVGYTNAVSSYYSACSGFFPPEEETPRYYKEREMVSCFIAAHYKAGDKVYSQVFQNLVRQHEKRYGNPDSKEFIRQHYSTEQIQISKKERLPNILMACYALKSGGGEIYPIHLANELHRHGIAVTIVNFNTEEEERGIRQLINANVPVVTIRSKDFLGHVITQLGGDIIHSHNASTDEAISQWIIHDRALCRHVITLHGMYESIREEDCSRVIADTWESCEKYVYIADKNLDCFRSRGYDISKKFIRIPNGMPHVGINPILRASLGIPEDVFVLAVASRGIPQKGWQEAVCATVAANRLSDRPIHLVIMGDGEVRAELEKAAPPFVHFTGFRPNVRDYFAMADAGLVPTYFRGESYPLVIIECLMAGIPVIATDIAEAKNQLKDENGNLAGILLPLHDWKVNENDIAAAILKLANSDNYYTLLKGRTYSACQKFDMPSIADTHICLYREIADERY